MKLVYLRIEGSPNEINHKQDFNFWSKYAFSITPIGEKLELSYKENVNYIEGFFNKNIFDITAIVGKNGAGKTSLLDFLRLNVAQDIGTTNLRFICILKSDVSGEKLLLYNSTNRKIKIRGGNLKFKDIPSGRINGRLLSLIDPTPFIHYSSVFNFNGEYMPFDIDISYTASLHELSEGNFEGSSIISQFQHLETVENIDFLLNYKGKMPFDISNEVYINPTVSKVSILRKLYPELELDPIFIIRLNTFDTFWQKEYYKNAEQSDFNLILQSIIISVFRIFINNKQTKYLLDILPDKYSRNFSYQNFLLELCDKLHSKGIEIAKYVPERNDINHFITLFKQLERKKVIYYWGARYNIVFEKKNYKIITEFLNAYFKISKKSDSLSFYFNGMSSGESAYLSLLSRLYSSKKKIAAYARRINQSRLGHGEARLTNIKDYILLIDEGELYLHPQWQKEFIYNLVTFIPLVYPNVSIQIILTSNSPFLISDLPKSNMIFLKKNQLNQKYDIFFQDKSTFAANFYSILSDSFFLEDGTIGKFAKTRIENALKYINDSSAETLLKEKTDWEKFINIIDEPIIAGKLKQMILSKISNTNFEEQSLILIKEKIDFRLKELRNQ